MKLKYQIQLLRAHVNTLRSPVPNGEPCKDSESGRGVNRLEEAPHLRRIFRILVSDRVDLSVGSSRVKVCLQEGLDIGIGALEIRIKPACLKCLVCEGTHVISWLYREKRLETLKRS